LFPHSHWADYSDSLVSAPDLNYFGPSIPVKASALAVKNRQVSQQGCCRDDHIEGRDLRTATVATQFGCDASERASRWRIEGDRLNGCFGHL
jgi:hypothetical protein